MIVTVNKEVVTFIPINGDRAARLVTEASTLELRPGEWPDFIGVVDHDDQGFLFRRAEDIKNLGGDLGGVNYRTRDGMLLVVFND